MNLFSCWLVSFHLSSLDNFYAQLGILFRTMCMPGTLCICQTKRKNVVMRIVLNVEINESDIMKKEISTM
jgi:hypothetical protein